MTKRLSNQCFIGIALSLIGFALAGCSVTTFNPPLTSTIGGITLDTLRQIQRDERLTDDEKRAQIRAATGAPDTPEGDRLVNFLLALTIQ